MTSLHKPLFELPTNWWDDCDGNTCDCGAYGQCECGCFDVDWTPREVYQLKEALNKLHHTLQNNVGEPVTWEDARRTQAMLTEALDYLEHLPQTINHHGI